MATSGKKGIPIYLGGFLGFLAVILLQIATGGGVFIYPAAEMARADVRVFGISVYRASGPEEDIRHRMNWWANGLALVLCGGGGLAGELAAKAINKRFFGSGRERAPDQ